MRIARHVAHLGIAALVLLQAFPAFAEGGATGDAGQGFELPVAPTLEDVDPTLIDITPTLGAEISQADEGGSHTPSSAEGTVAAEADPSTHVVASAPGCVIDITSALVVDGAGDPAPSSAPAEQATAD